MESLVWTMMTVVATVGLLACVLFIFFLGVFIGTGLGLEMAVDGSRKKGFFETYGSKWKAVEVRE